MRSWTLVAAGVAMVAVAGCSTSVSGRADPIGAASQGGGAQIASVADLGAVVQHNAVAKNSVHVEASINVPGEGALTATGDMTFGNDTASGQLDMNLPGLGQFTIVVIGTSVYMKLPADMLSQLSNGSADKPWVRVPLDGAASASLGSTANLAGEMDPTHMIAEIKSAGTISQVSRETIDGVPTTHYAIDVNVAKLAQTMTDNPLEEQNLSRVTVPSVPFDLWVNSQDLPIRIVSTMFLNATASAQPQQVTTTTNYSQWGEQVSISAPPADQVTQLGG